MDDTVTAQYWISHVETHAMHEILASISARVNMIKNVNPIYKLHNNTVQ